SAVSERERLTSLLFLGSWITQPPLFTPRLDEHIAQAMPLRHRGYRARSETARHRGKNSPCFPSPFQKAWRGLCGRLNSFVPHFVKLADVPNSTSKVPPTTEAMLATSPARVAMLMPPDKMLAKPPRITPTIVWVVVRVVCTCFSRS